MAARNMQRIEINIKKKKSASISLSTRIIPGCTVKKIHKKERNFCTIYVTFSFLRCIFSRYLVDPYGKVKIAKYIFLVRVILKIKTK